MRGHRRGRRGVHPRGGLAHLDRLQPRRLAPGHPLGRGRSGQGALRPAHLAHAARHALLVPGRRDRPDRRADRTARTCSMPWASASGPTTRAATPSGRPCPGPTCPAAAYCPEGVRPWLPMGDPAQCNVADQAADPGSILAFTRRVIARRAANADLAARQLRQPGLARGHLGLSPGAGHHGGPQPVGPAPVHREGVDGRGHGGHRPRPRRPERPAAAGHSTLGAGAVLEA